MSKKDQQHIVPRTYLKHWRIAEDQNFVYGLQIPSKSENKIQIYGLNDKVFKERKFYNDGTLSNPYSIEDMLGQDIEPNYSKIMAEISSEVNLSQKNRELLIQWLFFSKQRSPNIRSNTESIINFIYKSTLEFNKLLTPENEVIVKDIAKAEAKDIHLSALVGREGTEKLLMLYIETLNAKHWRILKSHTSCFWTNDNPGFSPNVDPRFIHYQPFHPVMQMSWDSFIFFPLSPKYCLEIKPFKEGTPLEVCAMEMNIDYEEVNDDYVSFINRGILATCNKIVVSNQKEGLEKITSVNS